MSLTRRALLLGLVGGAGVVGAGVALERPAAHRLDQWLHPIPEPSSSVPSNQSRQYDGSFRSAAFGGRSIGWSIAYPPGARRDLPVAIVFHGRGDDHGAVLGSHKWGHFLAAAVAAGTPPFAIAAVDGGDHSYWHRRANGDDPQRMLFDEFLPMLAARGLRTSRIGLAGWSMGGYGALLVAERLGSAGCAVLAVDSPALWRKAGDSAPGAFDDAADFARNDVFAARAKLAGIPTRLAIGTSDPFYRAARTFVAGMTPHPVTDFSPGGHDMAFWHHSAPAQIAFLGRHLVAVEPAGKAH